ncbi:MAG: MBL fold metallo-hydrolase [Haloarculaceae archaeon]
MTPAALSARLDAGEDVTVLDVRDRAEVDAWHVDAPRLANVPYAKWLAADVRGSVADLAAEVEDAAPVVVVCARGQASAYVASLLVREGVEARTLAGGMRGWARLYQATELDVDADGATVLQYRRPSSGCLAYLVVSGEAAAVVDPLRAFADRYVADAAERGADLVAAVDTHVHADHVSGVRALRDAAGATVVLPAGATERGLAFEATLLADGGSVQVGDVALEAVHAPGHTSEMTALRLGDLLLTGDALFLRSVPRPDLEAGDAGVPDLARRLHATLTERFRVLPDAVAVAPGHYASEAERGPDGTYAATLGEARARLPVFEADADAFVEHVLDDAPPRPANFETVVAVNLGRESVGDDAAFELELGPNNCAASAAD